MTILSRIIFRAAHPFAVLLVFCITTITAAQQALVPEKVPLSDAVTSALEAPWLNDLERSTLRVFHGVWDDDDLRTPELKAIAALNDWRLHDASLTDPAVPIQLRAEALLRAGEVEEALALVENETDLTATRIRAEGFETLGRFDDASKAVAGPADLLRENRIEDAAQLTDAVRALIVRSRIEGQPSRDFQAMMKLLAEVHQQIDRLYWPAKLAEAELLSDKDNAREAAMALYETLMLNPRCSEAWYFLGRLAIERFSFESAQVAAEHLWAINPEHPLAMLLIAEVRLVEDDPDGALETLAPLRKRWPKFRAAIAFAAAAEAIRYDEAALRRALAEYDALSPGSARAYAVVGRYLALNRQYDEAAKALEEAIRRQPSWPAPQIELGLLELQSGRDEKALTVLREVVALDPFNKRATNSLFLLESLADYKQIETEHFIVRYEPGIDEVMVDMMPEQLERIHAVVSRRFGFEPDRITTIELMPNHERFAVRITGMPWIHTMAACTGPVIAMEPPREGPAGKHLGLFDWPRVIQHEYTHTITLAQTRNRIPHWLTEAAAVDMEPGPRDYDRCQMLAVSHRDGTLFNLEEIKWAFVRPKLPQDRGKAYGQSHWMVEYIGQRWGESALVRLLERYFEGDREQDALPKALGVSREQFFEDFLVWAGEEIKKWGLDPEPSLDTLTDELRANDPDLALELAASQQARLDAIARALTQQIGRSSSPTARKITADMWPHLVRPGVKITEAKLLEWLDTYPDQPDLWELRIRRRLNERDEVDEIMIPWLETYAKLRPVDPLPHKQLARYYLAGETPEKAIPHLEYVDVREEKSPVFAIELAKLYRREGNAPKAIEKITRALGINPYSAPIRELAASIAVEAGDLKLALLHIKALTLIEPDRKIHQQRLQKIEQMLSARGG